MNESDLQLLARYARQHAEDAFAEIVRRHLNLVFSAALRQVRSPQLAEEVAQSAFVDLARQADRLAPETILSAWLYQITRRTAIDVVRGEARRQLREQVAYELNAMNASAADWTQIEPLLDDAMAALDETDRAAVLLRYFENKSLREVGQTLGTNEDAARKRVSRAVGRLHEFFAARGVTVGASSLAIVISVNAVQAAPTGLVLTISTAAAIVGTTLATTAGVTKAIAMTALQKTLIAAALAAAVGTGIYEARQGSKLRDQNQTLLQRQARLAEQIQQLQSERDETARQLAALREDNARLNGNSGELLRLRNELAQLKAGTIEKQNDPAESVLRSWLARVSQLRQRLDQMPDKWIPELKYLAETDWLETVRNAKVDSEIEARQALNALRNVAKEKVAAVFSEALKRYVKANDGRFPAEVAQLKPYFGSPMDDSILQRYAILPARDVTNGGWTESGGNWLIAEKTRVDVDYDTRFVIGTRAYGKSDFDADALIPAVIAFQTANKGQELGHPSRLLPYVQTPEQQRALEKWIERFPSLQK